MKTNTALPCRPSLIDELPEVASGVSLQIIDPFFPLFWEEVT
jgi:hypothetical protein